MKIITLAFVALLAASSLASAQVSQKLVDTAYTRNVGVKDAENELEESQLKLERNTADPLATKRDVFEAQLDVRTNTANLIAAKLEVRQNLTRELLAWDEAKDELHVVGMKLESAQQSLKSSQIKYQNGAINAVELARAEDAAQSAVTDKNKAENDVVVAASAVTRRLGTLPQDLKLEVTPRPELKTLKDSLMEHKNVLQAKASLERAQFDLRVKDNEFTPQSEITQAKNSVKLNEKRLEDAIQSQRVALQNAWDAFQNALNAIASRERSLEVSRNDLAGQQTRLAKGLVSKLSVLNTQITFESAKNSLQASRNAVMRAVTDLAVAANVDVWSAVK
jgi:outer membrane protein, heavy metal efflux system